MRNPLASFPRAVAVAGLLFGLTLARSAARADQTPSRPLAEQPRDRSDEAKQAPNAAARIRSKQQTRQLAPSHLVCEYRPRDFDSSLRCERQDRQGSRRGARRASLRRARSRPPAYDDARSPHATAALSGRLPLSLARSDRHLRVSQAGPAAGGAARRRARHRFPASRKCAPRRWRRICVRFPASAWGSTRIGRRSSSIWIRGTEATTGSTRHRPARRCRSRPVAGGNLLRATRRTRRPTTCPKRASPNRRRKRRRARHRRPSPCSPRSRSSKRIPDL